MMKFVALIIVSLFMMGATTCQVRDTVIGKAADINDEAVNSAQFTICYGASVGSIRRAFGDRPALWRELCTQDSGFEPSP